MALDWITWLLSGVCHQMPEHCLAYQGQPLPLCARCSGMFLGIWLSLLLQFPKSRRSGLPPLGINLALAVCLLIWAIDGVNSMVSEIMARSWIYTPHNDARLITGTFCGLALGVWLYPILHEALGWSGDRQPAIARWRDLLSLGLAGAVCDMTMLLWLDAPYRLWAGLASAACLATFWLVNTSLVGMLWPLHANRSRVIPLAWRMLAGGAMALVEMGGMALLRGWLGA